MSNDKFLLTMIQFCVFYDHFGRRIMQLQHICSCDYFYLDWFHLDGLIYFHKDKKILKQNLKKNF